MAAKARAVRERHRRRLRLPLQQPQRAREDTHHKQPPPFFPRPRRTLGPRAVNRVSVHTSSTHHAGLVITRVFIDHRVAAACSTYMHRSWTTLMPARAHTSALASSRMPLWSHTAAGRACRHCAAVGGRPSACACACCARLPRHAPLRCRPRAPPRQQGVERRPPRPAAAAAARPRPCGTRAALESQSPPGSTPE